MCVCSLHHIQVPSRYGPMEGPYGLTAIGLEPLQERVHGTAAFASETAGKGWYRRAAVARRQGCNLGDCTIFLKKS